jgi:hypothetical protein
MKDTVSHYVPPHSPLTSTEPTSINNLTMPTKQPPGIRSCRAGVDGGLQSRMKPLLRIKKSARRCR